MRVRLSTEATVEFQRLYEVAFPQSETDRIRDLLVRMGHDEIAAATALSRLALAVAERLIGMQVEALSDCGTLLPPLTVSGEGSVASPDGKATLPKQLAKLTCGQTLIVLIIGLSVLLYCDLPPAARDQIASLITVLSAAIWTISKIAKK
jgi:hypothetical protein